MKQTYISYNLEDISYICNIYILLWVYISLMNTYYTNEYSVPVKAEMFKFPGLWIKLSEWVT